MTGTFNMLDHLDKLTPAEGRDKKGYYLCPVCGDDNFTVAKTGAYQCWGSQCKAEDIRNAVSPLQKSDSLPPVQYDKILHLKQNKQVDLSVAEVKAQADHHAMMVAEKIYPLAEARLRLTEWCRSNRYDAYTAKGVLDESLEEVGVGDGTLDPTDDAKLLRALVRAYTEEKDLPCQVVLRNRLRSRFRVNDAQLEGLIEVVSPAENLDYLHCSEDIDQNYMMRLQALQEGTIAPGLDTGIAAWDWMLGGMEKKTLHVIGGRPSQGKSVLAQTVVRNVLKKYRVPVAMFSLEMTITQWKDRWVAAERSIDHAKVRKGKLTPDEWSSVFDCMVYFDELPLFLSEASGITPSYLKRSCIAIAETAQQQYGQDLGLIVVDYLNLMQIPGQLPRVQEVSKIARSLQSLAKEMGCPVLALSQLNRGNVSRNTKEPSLEDLRESGEIEQVAESVTFVHRPGKYDKSIPESDGKLVLAKNRPGETGICNVLFEGKYQRFRDVSARIG